MAEVARRIRNIVWEYDAVILDSQISYQTGRCRNHGGVRDKREFITLERHSRLVRVEVRTGSNIEQITFVTRLCQVKGSAHRRSENFVHWLWHKLRPAAAENKTCVWSVRWSMWHPFPM